MSIATDEAERRYPIEYSNFDCDVSKLSACRTAFSLGAEWQSQREPTEAEIEAAAKAMYENCAARWHASSSSGKWANAQVHKEYLVKARFALEAARKAVTGDE